MIAANRFFNIINALTSMSIVALAGCYSSTSHEQRRAERIRMNPAYNQKLAEKSTTEGRIKYFLAQGDTSAAQEEMRILKLQENEIDDAKNNADNGETSEWIYDNTKHMLNNSK